MSTPDTDARRHGALDNPDVAHETSDINVRAILWFIASLVAVSIGVHVIVYGLFAVFEGQEAKNDPVLSPLAMPAGQLPPEPRLQTTPHEDLQLMLRNEAQVLDSYGWVDEKAGIARLPIERAKALILERGLPARAGAEDPTEGTHVAASGESNSAQMIPAGLPDRSSVAAPVAPATQPTLPRGAKPGGSAP